jgi:hypothetical protein
MSDIKEFQNDVRDLIGGEFNFSLDQPHADKPEHIDLTARFEGGADKVEVDFNGDVIGGSTQIGPVNLKWNPSNDQL